MFNSLLYAKKLEEVGFTREQAETHVLIMSELMKSDLATKEDMRAFGSTMESEMQNFTFEAQDRINELKNELAQFEHRFTFKMAIMMTAAVTILISFMSLMINVR